jgi:ABC-type bacteriocin/lantibiotic exporter with double-glycine peptidase domain
MSVKGSLDKAFVLQQDQSDCGVACLLTIINYHGGGGSLEQLRKLSGTSRQGTTLLGLYQAAQQLGFNAEGLEAESVSNLGELSEPAILHVLVEQRLQHYVVYFPEQSLNGKIQIFDPARGMVTLTATSLNEIWQSKALLKLVPNGSFKKAIAQKAQKRTWLLELIKPDAPLLLISLVLGIAISVLGISTAIFSQKLIDDILPRENTEKLWLSLVLVALLLLARSGLGYLRGLFIIRQSMDFNNRIIQSFYNNLLGLPKVFFDTRKIGELIARMNDTRRIQTVLSVVAGSVVIDMLVVITSLTFLFAYSYVVGLFMLGCLPVYLLILYRFNKPIISAQKSAMAGYALTESNFVDTMQGVGEIKLTNRQSFFEKLNATIYGEFQSRISNLGKLQNRFGWVSEVTGVIFLITVFGVSSWLVLKKELLLGEMVALLGMAGGIVPSLNRLIISNIQVQEALVAFDRMFEFTSMDKEPMEGLPLNQPVTNLNIKSLSFRFPGRRQILTDVSFAVSRGQMVAIKGESGGGKSTLMQIIQKFYSPESGQIEVNGTDLAGINTTVWRSVVGYVPQEVKIFNGNLAFNITLSDDLKEVEAAITFCRDFGFEKFFEAFPQSYLTLLGEEGVNISGGQKQLVALARTLYKRPQVLLLDEATSAMDRRTEQFVLDLLTKLKAEMAVIFVTHRNDTAAFCDQVYELRQGTLAKAG